MQKVKLCSWNCAGFGSSVEKIQKFNNLEEWMIRHDFDILCLQEVKSSKDRLQDLLTMKFLQNYEAFSSFCSKSCSDRGQRGMNGVTTISRKGLTLSARSDVFEEQAFDEEGRAVLTDHGAFFLFNVYVPNSSENYRRLSYKIDFLEKLYKKIEYYREIKPVVCCGDFNLIIEKTDIPWTNLLLDFDELELISKNENSPEFKNILLNALKCFPVLKEAVKKVEIYTSHRQKPVIKDDIAAINFSQPLESQKPREEDFEGRCRGKLMINGKRFIFNEVFESLLECRFFHEKMFDELRVGTEIIQKKNSIQSKLFTEFYAFYYGKDSDLRKFCERYGKVFQTPRISRFVSSMKKNFIDSFYQHLEKAKSRYTCWDQQKSARYRNLGSRIDFVFIDRNLYPSTCSEFSHSLPHSDEYGNSYSERAGLLAAKGSNAWTSLTKNDLTRQSDSVQFLHKTDFGIVYFPPEYSDHVGVVASFRFDPTRFTPFFHTKLTRLSQAQKSVKLLTEYFGKRTIQDVEEDKRKIARTSES